METKLHMNIKEVSSNVGKKYISIRFATCINGPVRFKFDLMVLHICKAAVLKFRNRIIKLSLDYDTRLIILIK